MRFYAMYEKGRKRLESKCIKVTLPRLKRNQRLFKEVLPIFESIFREMDQQLKEFVQVAEKERPSLDKQLKSGSWICLKGE